MTLLLEYLYKGHWDKRHGSVSVLAFKSAFFGKAVGTVRTTGKVGKTLDFIESNNSAAAGRFILFPQIILRNEMIFIVSAQLRGLLLRSTIPSKQTWNCLKINKCK